MDTEDRIFSYVKSEVETPLDEPDIYSPEETKEHLMTLLEDERTCQLCKQIYSHAFTPLKDLESDFIHKYIPQMNFTSIDESILCSSCIDSLKTQRRLLKNTSDAQDETTIISEETQGPFHIKTEEIEMKTEEEIGTTPDGDDETSQNKEVTPKTLSQLAQKYKCNICNFEAKYKGNLTRHLLEHKGNSNAQMYRCEICNFETKIKRDLPLHLLKHKNNSEVEMYTCGTCDFETKYKGSLARHLLQHEPKSKPQMYHCDICYFETSVKRNLTNHRLTHESGPEVQRYKCDRCKYTSKFHRYLMRHQQKHDSEAYKCKSCDFETKDKNYLALHQLRHKDVSEIQMYKCHTCSYETRYKHLLKQHQVVHKDIGQVQMYSCDLCRFKTKRKSALGYHRQVKHDGVPQEQIYKCDECNYEAKYEKHLERHRQVHRKVSEDLKGNTSPAMDNATCLKTSESFEFKAIETDIDDNIFTYVKSETEIELDQPDMYYPEESKEHLKTVLEDERICELCKQICTHGFTIVNDLESELIREYAPEVNSSSTKGSVICSSCLDSVTTHRRFLPNSSDVQDKISDTFEKEGPLYIKIEEIDMKSEDEVRNAPSCVDKSHEDQTSQNHEVTQKTLSNEHRPTRKAHFEEQMYKCKSCNYKTKYEGRFARHLLGHKDNSQMQVFKCGSCNYETKYKHHLKQHQLQHKNVSELEMYKCESCNFETKNKNYLTYHQMKHKNNSEVQVYKCDECSFETKHKSSLYRHLLKHSQTHQPALRSS